MPYLTEQFHNPAIYANQDTKSNKSHSILQYARRLLGVRKVLCVISCCKSAASILFVQITMWSSLVALLALSSSALATKNTPTVRVKNGTIAGVHSPSYNQDFFLGVPFAQPPLGDLRFRQAQSLNATWNGSWDAKQYATFCVGYGVSIQFEWLLYWSSSYNDSLIKLSTTPQRTACTSTSYGRLGMRIKNYQLPSGSTAGDSQTVRQKLLESRKCCN